MEKSVLILHGPNLNLLGERETSVYGDLTLAEIDSRLETYAEELGLNIRSEQSNHEGELIDHLHQASLSILADPGIWCYSRRTADLFAAAGAHVREDVEHGQPLWRISLPAGLVQEAVGKAPSRLVLGAREPENRLLLDAQTPRVYFGSGSETNVWLETEMETFVSASNPAA